MRWQNRLDAEKALRRQGTILRAYTESTGQGQKQLQRHDQGRLFDVKDGGTPLESLAMDYMVGVMRYSKAKQVLGTQNETIYWQSPIRKKNIVLDKKNYRDKERPTALSNIPRTSSLSNGPRVPVDEQSHPAFSIFQAPAESTLRENGNYSILDRVLDILF